MYQQREDFPGTANVWLAYAGVSTCTCILFKSYAYKMTVRKHQQSHTADTGQKLMSLQRSVCTLKKYFDQSDIWLSSTCFQEKRKLNLAFSVSQGKLFCRCDDNAHPQLCVVDPKSLEVLSSCKMDGKYWYRLLHTYKV